MSRFLVVFLIGVIIALIFSMQNNTSITIYFGPWQFQGSIALILLIAFSLGFILSIISVAPTLIKNRFTTSKQQKRIQELEKQISEGKEEKKS
ncbi:MAG: LapA family protein [Dictyoglomus sp.]|uniref:LapA family protein n=1 Tax=Dictyoglomus sp. TaxID=28205 RepID=UPI003CACCC60